MRNLIFILLMVGSQAFGQSYTAIHVIGKIYLPSKQEYLKRGTKLSESEKIEFQSSDAKAAMLSSSRGRYVIQPGPKNTSSDNLAFALGSIITPVKGQMSTRSGSINNALDFQKQLGESPVAWLNEKMSLNVSETSYPIDENRFFYMAYSYNGEVINKKLSNDGQSLQFIKSEVFKVDDQPIEASKVNGMELYYYDLDKGEASLMTAPQLIAVSSDQLIELQASLSEESPEALLEFINSLYGRCSQEQLDAAISSLK